MDGKDPEDVERLDVAPGQPTLQELTEGVTQPIAGGDTLAASRAILEKLKGAEDGR